MKHATDIAKYESLQSRRSKYMHFLFDKLEMEDVQEAIDEGRRIHMMITYINRKVKKNEELTQAELHNNSDFNKETYKIYTNYKRCDSQLLQLNLTKKELFMIRRNKMNELYN